MIVIAWLIGLLIKFSMIFWVYNDAKSRHGRGLAALWALGVFLAGLWALIAYVLLARD